MDQQELEKNAQLRAEALEPVVEQLRLVVDLLVQIREELKRGRV